MRTPMLVTQFRDQTVFRAPYLSVNYFPDVLDISWQGLAMADGHYMTYDVAAGRIEYRFDNGHAVYDIIDWGSDGRAIALPQEREWWPPHAQ